MSGASTLQGVLFGVGAGSAWGVSDYAIAVMAKRVGFFAVLVAVQAASVVLLAALALLVVDVPSPTAGQWLACAALGPLSVLCYVGFYRGLELGPVAVVSPIVAASAAMTVVLAVILLGEVLSAGQALGCALTLAGVILAAARLGALADGELRLGRGPAFAGVAMIGFGFYLYALARLSKDLGWLLPILLTRASALALMACYALAVPASRQGWGGLGRRFAWSALLVGGLEGGGYLLFNRGTELGYVSIVAAAASLYPLIPIAGGIVLLHERLARNQLAGIGVVVGGLLVLGLAG